MPTAVKGRWHHIYRGNSSLGSMGFTVDAARLASCQGEQFLLCILLSVNALVDLLEDVENVIE